MAPDEIITVDKPVVSCNGGGGALGHPLVYLHTDEDGEVICPYCSRHFVLAAGADTHADH